MKRDASLPVATVAVTVDIVFQPATWGAGIYPNDSLFPTQYNLHNTGQNGGTPGADIHALEAWNITRCSPDIVIAILDTGVDPNQPDLKDKLVPGATFIDGTATPDDDNGHGTEMAGAAAAATDNGAGVAGVCPHGHIMPVKVATARGHTDDAEGNPRVAAGIRWAVDHGANVISFSLGVGDNPAMRDAVAYAYRHNVLIVAAAGNSGSATSSYPGPAYFPHVLAVGGTDNKDQRMSYSNYGMDHLVMAPSVDVPTTGRNGTYGMGGYTSIAAPQVAGVAALLLSVRPDLTVDELIDLIEKGADPIEDQEGYDPKVGYGRVNAHRSLQIALASVRATPRRHGDSTRTSTSFTASVTSAAPGQSELYVVNGNDLSGTASDNRLLPGATYSVNVVAMSSVGTQIGNNGGRRYQITIPAAPTSTGL